MDGHVLSIREGIDPTNKDTFLFDDQVISHGQRDRLPPFLCWGRGGGDGGPRSPGRSSAPMSLGCDLRKRSLRTTGKLQTKSQRFPSLVKSKRKLEVFMAGGLLGLVEK